MTDLTVPAGDTETIAAGTRYWAAPINVAGELNLAGELSTDDATPISGSGQGTSDGAAAVQTTNPGKLLAIGSGTGVGTGALEAERRITTNIGVLTFPIQFDATFQGTKGGVGQGVGTASVSAAFDPVASGTGTGVGAADLNLVGGGELSAGGIGDGLGSATAGIESDTVAAGAGTMVGAATIGADRALTSALTGRGVGTAATTRTLDANADGVGQGIGLGDLSKVVPAVRQDDATIQFDPTENFTLATDG
jgi:hypothetical protein